MMTKCPKLASVAQKICTLYFQFFDAFFASKGYPFKHIFENLVQNIYRNKLCILANERNVNIYGAEAS